MAGQAGKASWLTTDWVLSHFGRRRGDAEQVYRDFVSEGREQSSIWEQLQHQLYLGSERFISGVQKRITARQDLSEIPRAHRRSPPKPLRAYVPGRGDPKVSMVRAYASGGYTLKEIGEHFGVHYSTVSRAVKSHEDSSRG